MIAQRIAAAAGRAVSAVGWVRRFPDRVRAARLDRADRAEAERRVLAGPSVRERLEDLIKFYNQHDELIGTLCDAAQYGPEPRLEARYAQLRGWMQTNYREMRKYVVAYLQYDPADSAQSLQESGSDAFESLFAAPTLDEFLRCDDGLMIDRIERTREALSLYGEHLRALEKA